MQHLYAPWRNDYISSSEKPEGCFFCQGLALPENNPENLIIHRGQRAFVLLIRYPYTNGHLMVVPCEHNGRLEQLDAGTRSELMELITRSVQALTSVYQPAGFNIGSNIGIAAGAGVPDHVHFHVLPRWVGDTNFTTTVGQTRVLPETLEDTWRRLTDAWQRLA